MKKWCELSLKGDETASKIVFTLISNDFKITDWIVDICLGLNSNLKKKYKKDDLCYLATEETMNRNLDLFHNDLGLARYLISI